MSVNATLPHRRGVSRKRLDLALRLAGCFVTVVILWLTLTPASAPSFMSFTFADKLWHMLAFGGWAGIVAAGWRGWGWPVLLAGAAIFGGAIELIQPLAGREADLADWAADLLGAGLGVWGGRSLRAWIDRE